MQPPDVNLVTNFRITLFVILFILIFLSTRQSSRTLREAWRLPIIYPDESEDSKRMVRERESLLRTLSLRWSLFTLLDYSLGVYIIYEAAAGSAAVVVGPEYYFAYHLPTAIAVSFVGGLLFAVVVAWIRSPFRSGRIEPLKHLLMTLDTLVTAAQTGDEAVALESEDILLKLVRKEIDRFMEHREMGDAERGRLLEYLSKEKGAQGRAASALLWPE